MFCIHNEIHGRKKFTTGATKMVCNTLNLGTCHLISFNMLLKGVSETVSFSIKQITPDGQLCGDFKKYTLANTRGVWGAILMLLQNLQQY